MDLSLMYLIKFHCCLASSMQCQSGWTRSGLSCYLLVAIPKAWDEAETDCINKGGHLTSIASDNENSLVLTLRGTSTADTDDAWIGLNDRVLEDTFVWSDGTQSTYTNWDGSISEPNGSGDCARIVSDGTWRDQRCTSVYPYMCKYDLTPSTYTTQSPTTLSATTLHTSTAATTTIPTKSSTTPSTTSRSLTATRDRSTTTTRNSATILTVTSQSTLRPTTLLLPTTPEVSSKSSINVSTHASSTEITRQATSTTSEAGMLTARASSTKTIGTEHTPTSLDRDTPTSADETVVAGETKTSSSNSALYAGVAAAVAVTVLIASVILACLFWKRRKSKHRSETSQTHSAGGCHFNDHGLATLDDNVYCDPTAAVYCDPTATVSHDPTKPTMINKPTEALIQMLESENQYLACAFRDYLQTLQSSNRQQTNDDATTTTRDEDEFYQARLINVAPAEYAEIVGKGFDIESPETAYECLVEQPQAITTTEANTRCYQNVAFGEDSELAAAEVTEGEQDILPTLLSVEDEDTYCEPASTEQELYGQLEGHRFRQIYRCDVTNMENIGSGAFGFVEKAVWRANDRENIAVAVKTLKNEADASDRVKFLREAVITGQFRHRNLIRLYGVVIVGSPIMLVLEYMQNGDLKNYLEKHRLESVGKCCFTGFDKMLLKMCRDIANGMEYLSRKSFVHRDVAARNVLLDSKLTSKIADFGMARDVSDDTYYTITGGKLPIKWCAPEIWNYKRFSTASDVWSYGVVLYEVWSVGLRPFGYINNSEVMKKVEIGYRLPPPPGCSRSLYRLMIDCWHPDSHERPSFGNIVQRLATADEFLLSNRNGEALIEGKLGDELNVSENCYTDLQHIYKKY